MENIYKEYINNIKKIPLQEKKEHTDRTHLENLLKDLIGSDKSSKQSILIQHEPKNDKGGLGAPDFLVKTNESIVGYIEVKKIEQNLDETLKSDQIEKYKKLSNNIILTNYIEFIWIKDGTVLQRENLLFIHELESNKVKLDIQKIKKINEILKNFFLNTPEKIGSISKLANYLAERAKTLKNLLEEKLDQSLADEKKNELTGTYKVFCDNIYSPEFTVKEFSDSIAQTITYGLFLAKLNNKEESKIEFHNIRHFIPDNFELIKNVFKLIEDIGKGSKEYSDLKWILDELIGVVNNIDSNAISHELSFSKNKKVDDEYFKDPYLYFYEDFLGQYDKALRKSRGVYYTPTPVVDYIVKSLNALLKNKFELPKGFAERDSVTVLDFATGTGTFLLEVIKTILKEVPKESGKQKEYVRKHILKNIKGFEYLMAPYVVSHLKLSEFLKEEADFNFNDSDSLQVYLTNALDLSLKTEQSSMPFLQAIEKEHKLANAVKTEPVLVILGNPPYSVGSKNKNDHIEKLMKEYKLIEGQKLGEKALIALSDDYVKFIRFAENKMEKADKGIIGIISNNGFLDNITFRGMRYHLLKTFDEIYILNLHGNLRKKEKSEDGSADENVFDIQAGVSINIFVKKKQSIAPPEFAKLYYKSLQGSRAVKYNYLNENDISSSPFNELVPKEPNYFFTPQNEEGLEKYNTGRSLADIFEDYNSGVETQKDSMVIDFTPPELLRKLKDFASLSEQDARHKYNLGEDGRDWTVKKAQEELKDTKIDKNYIKEITYRPFDCRYIYYTGKQGIVVAPRFKTMKHMTGIENNLGLIAPKLLTGSNFKHALICNNISERGFISSKTSEGSYIFPLYVQEGVLELRENFKHEFRQFIDAHYKTVFTPEQILGYIYAVLHSRTYRETYFEFLKIDYPKIIFVNDREAFQELSDLGQRLINYHLLRDTAGLDKTIGGHISTGETKRIVQKIVYSEESLEFNYNKDHKFRNVAPDVFEFVIGSYQVIPKYLNYRKGRELSLD